MKLTLVLIFLCVCLQVEISAAQCAAATILPSDVSPSIDDEFFTSQLTKQIAELQETISKIVQAYHVDVYSIAVVYRNSTIYSAGLVDTPFRIASITKVFTALGPLLLQKQGVHLNLDDPVKKFLPSFSVVDPDSVHAITLRELMGHTSGLPRDLCVGFCEPDLSEEDSLELVAKMQLARPPWSFLPVYSNLGFAILGHAWEKATSPRKTWSKFLKDELLGPLGMHHTGVPVDLDVEEVELAPGNMYPYLANYSIGWQAPCGDMYSTALDLAKFLKFLLHPTPLLTYEAIREMTHPTTVFPDTSSVLTGYALPWELIEVIPSGTNRSTTLITKNGHLGTYGSVIAFHPDSQLGVAVLTSINATSIAAASQIYELLGIKIMKDLIPAVQSVHSNFISSLYSGFYVCNQTDPVVSAHLKKYTTLQVLGGSISVSTMTLDKNLVANYNVSLVQNGSHGFFTGSRSLVLKPGRERHAFWSSPGPCSAMASLLGSRPEIARPNFPGSVDLYEFQFEPEAKLLQWPALGGMCYKS